MRFDGSTAVLSLGGNWLLETVRPDFLETAKELKRSEAKLLRFEYAQLGEFDSTLVCFLVKCRKFCLARKIAFDIPSLPAGARALVELAVAVPDAESSHGAAKQDIIRKIGNRTINAVHGVGSQVEFTGELSMAAVKALFGRARYRMRDLLFLMQRTGPEALPIVALISFLVGLILAFVGAIQLAKYGSQIFTADLVGIAMVREMGAMMVGIVMSGRTGAAFAAELGAMKVNEEISAFRTFGISPMEFLVLPRVLALVAMFPLLTIFADLIGILGGFVIALGLFDISYDQFAGRTVAALNLVQISTGIGKSLLFGAIVAVIGCQKGLSCENSSSGVGQATTSGVVQSITWIIVADAVFAVLFTVFDI